MLGTYILGMAKVLQALQRRFAIVWLSAFTTVLAGNAYLLLKRTRECAPNLNLNFFKRFRILFHFLFLKESHPHTASFGHPMVDHGSPGSVVKRSILSFAWKVSKL